MHINLHVHFVSADTLSDIVTVTPHTFYRKKRQYLLEVSKYVALLVWKYVCEYVCDLSFVHRDFGRVPKRAMHIESNTEVGLINPYCLGKAVRITYSGCVFVTLGTQHAMRVLRIVICVVSGPILFFHVIS